MSFDQPTVVARAAMEQHDPTLHSELEKTTWSILNTARRTGPSWSVLSGGPMSEQEQCLYEAQQYQARAQELRAALALMPIDAALSSCGKGEQEDAAEAAAAVEEGQAFDGDEDEDEDNDEEGAAQEQEQEQAPKAAGGGFFGSLRNLGARLLGGGSASSKGLRETVALLQRYETMAECLRTQAELEHETFWPTSGQYVRPEELSLLHLARRIILCEGEKERFLEAHPDLDRHAAVSQELEDLSRRLLRYRTLFALRTGGRWFQAYQEDGLQVAADSAVPGSQPNAFHVQCFFDGAVTEQDLQDGVEYLRVHEAEKRARWRASQTLGAVASAPLRLFRWPFSSSADSDGRKRGSTVAAAAAAAAPETTLAATQQEGKAAAIVRFSLLHLWSQVAGTLAAIFGQGWGQTGEDHEEEGNEEDEGNAVDELQGTSAVALGKQQAVNAGIPSSEEQV